MFGPKAVHENYRVREIGKGLLLSCLHDMKAQNYAYAVIWWVDSVEFYSKSVGAVPIEGSAPGFYRGPLVKN